MLEWAALALFEPNLQRVLRAQKPVTSLRKNCLLTNSPIVFLTGSRSFFYFAGYWNRIPRYLRAHGYDVLTINLPWRDPSARESALRKHLEIFMRHQKAAHFVLDDTALHLLEILEQSDVTRTITVLSSEKRSSLPNQQPPIYFVPTPELPKSSWLKLHERMVGQKVAFSALAHPDQRPSESETTMLEHAIFLAENEM